MSKREVSKDELVHLLYEEYQMFGNDFTSIDDYYYEQTFYDPDAGELSFTFKNNFNMDTFIQNFKEKNLKKGLTLTIPFDAEDWVNLTFKISKHM